eukprot:2935389-Pyramimonas_sp.AAC.2
MHAHMPHAPYPATHRHSASRPPSVHSAIIILVFPARAPSHHPSLTARVHIVSEMCHYHEAYHDTQHPCMSLDGGKTPLSTLAPWEELDLLNHMCDVA